MKVGHEKRFPSDDRLVDEDGNQILRFLNNRKINGELYAYLQYISYGDKKYGTIVLKKDLKTQEEIGKMLRIGSRQTVAKEFKNLIDSGYLVKLEDGNYQLPVKEKRYYPIDDATINYILNWRDGEEVIKILIYLGQKWPGYEFTTEELLVHLGYDQKIIRGRSDLYNKIKMGLEFLMNSGLINYEIKNAGYRTVRKLISIQNHYIDESEMEKRQKQK